MVEKFVLDVDVSEAKERLDMLMDKAKDIRACVQEIIDIGVDSITPISFKPGDTIILSCDSKLLQGADEKIREIMRRVFTGCHCVVINQNMRFEVYRKEEGNE